MSKTIRRNKCENGWDYKKKKRDYRELKEKRRNKTEINLVMG